jgi:hypothetical protein
MIELLLALVTTQWRVSDTTDNTTGERTVMALRLAESELRGDYPGLFIACREGKVTLDLHWVDRLGKGYALISAKKGTPDDFFSLGRPVAWDVVHPDGDVASAPPDEAKRIVEGILGGTNLVLEIHGASSPQEALWYTEGMKAAYDRVAEHCH